MRLVFYQGMESGNETRVLPGGSLGMRLVFYQGMESGNETSV